MNTPICSFFSRVAPAAVSIFFLTLACTTHGKVTPAPLFVDHAVLQQGKKMPVWGTAQSGEKVTVTFNGQRRSATADANGHWSVKLSSVAAGGPYTMTIAGENTITLNDVLVGEVWICGGQSNMERQLGPRPPQKPILDWEKEAASANFPQIRHFGVAQTTAPSPRSTVGGEWTVCTPQTVGNFTAVGFFFGRAVHQARHVPVGLIHSSWGGTVAEAWMSHDGLKAFPVFSETLQRLEAQAADPAAAARAYVQTLRAWYAKDDPGSSTSQPWNSIDVSTEGWADMSLPTAWEEAGLPGLDGVVWFRKTIDLPEGWDKAKVTLNLGPIDDCDTTWVNGVEVGSTELWLTPRHYSLPAGTLKTGKNVIAIRVLDTSGNGGIWGNGERLSLTRNDGAGATDQIPLDGPWQYKIGVRFDSKSSRPPANLASTANAPTVLYNGMIAPLQPYAIRGVIWYQGEANAERAKQYRDLFPALITNWRQTWGQGDFPFLYVQIAPYEGMSPEIREAQLLTLKRVKNAAMAVTIDVGDAHDIHPTNKRPVGERLALAARALAYGEKVAYSGPEFTSLSADGKRAVLHFKHTEGGLIAKGGDALIGFTLAGADHVFHPAKAEIAGDTVVLTSDAVTTPVAARYGWANVPEGNLFNKADLPASPFRTDVD